MPLLTSRRLLPLLVTQALGAINDNMFKTALSVLVLFKASGSGGAELVPLANGVFILPYLLFSATAGQLADRFEKSRLMRATKLFELALMAVAALGLWLGSTKLLFAVLFGLGIQATFFGPLKYAVLPTHLRESELVAGNGLVEAGTFLGILAGTVAGSALVATAHGPVIVAVLGLLVAAAGVASASFLPPAPSSAPNLPIDWNLLRETGAVLRVARANRPVWLSLLGLSWFWVLGATVVAELPSVVRDQLGAQPPVFTLLLVFFSLGVGAGSVGCSRLLRGKVSARLVPFAALGLSLFLWDFARTAASAWPLPTVAAVLGSGAGWRLMTDLLLLAASGGLFSVPLYAILQERSAAAHRARMVAANNVVNAVAIVAGAVVVAGLAAAHWQAPAILLLAAGLNLLVAGWITRRLAQPTLRALLAGFCRRFHGATLRGLANLPPDGTRSGGRTRSPSRCYTAMDIASVKLSSGTEDPQLRAPAESALLAYAALVPLLAAAIAAWWLTSPASDLAIHLGTAWAGALLCFLAGVRRGLSFRQPGGPTVAQVGAMLWLFVLGAAALLSPWPNGALQSPWPNGALVLLLAGYLTLAIADPIAARRREAPRYFAHLRPVQMLLALACLAALLLHRLA